MLRIYFFTAQGEENANTENEKHHKCSTNEFTRNVKHVFIRCFLKKLNEHKHTDIQSEY